MTAQHAESHAPVPPPPTAEEYRAAQQLAEAGIIGHPCSFRMLIALVARGRLAHDDVRDHLNSVARLASAGLIFPADNEFLPSAHAYELARFAFDRFGMDDAPAEIERAKKPGYLSGQRG